MFIFGFYECLILNATIYMYAYIYARNLGLRWFILLIPPIFPIYSNIFKVWMLYAYNCNFVGISYPNLLAVHI